MPAIEFLITYFFLGCVVGVLSGLLGIGGGAIMVPVLTSVFLYQKIDPQIVVHVALGTSMASIVPTAVASSYAHYKRQAVNWFVVRHTVPGVLIGAISGTYVASQASTMILALFFSVFICLMAVYMFFSSEHYYKGKSLTVGGLFGAGVCIGGVSTLAAIGGGSMTVPYLLWHSVNMRHAIGTSSAIGVPIALLGTGGYVFYGWEQQFLNGENMGYIYYPALICIALGSILCASVGVYLAHKTPVLLLKKIFAVFLFLLSLHMLWFAVLQ